MNVTPNWPRQSPYNAAAYSISKQSENRGSQDVSSVNNDPLKKVVSAEDLTVLGQELLAKPFHELGEEELAKFCTSLVGHENNQAYTHVMRLGEQHVTLGCVPGQPFLTLITDTVPPTSITLKNTTIGQLKLAASFYLQSVSDVSRRQTIAWGWSLLIRDQEFAAFYSVLQNAVPLLQEPKFKTAYGLLAYPWAEKMRETFLRQRNNRYVDKLHNAKSLNYPINGLRFRWANCCQYKDNTQLNIYMDAVLKDADDLTRYPLDRTSLLRTDYHKEVIQGPLAYTFFVDRMLSAGDAYGPDRFENTYRDAADCSENYVLCSFKALDFLYNSKPLFSTSTNATELFGILRQTNQLARASLGNVLNAGKSTLTTSPPAFVHALYGCRSNLELNDPKFGCLFFCAKTLLNKEMLPSPLFRDQDIQHLNQFTALVLYDSEIQIIGFFSKHLGQYQKWLREAQSTDEITTAIIIFISMVEVSHYFSNGNNRTCCQGLINKLLIENNLPQTILYVPNGFSYYVLSILPWQVRIGAIELEQVPLAVLRELMEPALMTVREGQAFFKVALSVSKSRAVEDIVVETTPQTALPLFLS